MEGDEHNWLELDADTGELKTKAALDRETVEQITLTVIAYETGENTAPESTNALSFQANVIWYILQSISVPFRGRQAGG